MNDDVESFKSFIDGVEAIPDRLRNRATKGAAEQHQMALGAKDYLLRQYEGVEVVRSFRDPSGQIFDCVTFESQPSMRGVENTRIPVAPDLPLPDGAEAQQPSWQSSSRLVPSDTVAMRRITTADIVDFGGVEEYFSPEYAPQLDGDGNYHYHAHAEQAVTNYGMHSKMAVYKNPINLDKKHVFSLAQSWTTTSNPTQSIELCVICTPVKYKTTDPVLIVATTNDDYNPGSFGYNLEITAFVQTSNKWILGAPILPVSVKGGNQYYLTLATKLDAGKWWVYVGGETSADAIGYYPTSWFSNITKDGLAKASGYVDVGGEVMSGPRTPQTVPPMGSGVLGAADWKNVAYIRDVRYYPTTGGTANATLVPAADEDKNYKAVRARYATPWNETLWYGGPGVP